MPEKRDSFKLEDTIVLPGETRHTRLAVSESYVSTQVEIPITIVNGISEGPMLFVCGASHGDECNGTGIARELVYGVDHSDLRGVLVVAPVLNLPGFLRNERYLPDGRDLNRNFPGKPDGNPAQRIAHAIFRKMVKKCDYGIDLHTATRGRTNILQVRGDMSNKEVRRIARAFGTEIVIDEAGLGGTLRRAATEGGIPMITAEVGEAQRFEKELVQSGLRGVLNVLAELGMIKGKPVPPLFQVIVKKTEWVRANKGGILEMIAEPRGLVSEGEELCTITNPFGKEVGTVRAPFTGMVVGITNYPMVSPGSPICHLVKLDRTLSTVEAALRREKEARKRQAAPRPPVVEPGAPEGPEAPAAESAKEAGSATEPQPATAVERAVLEPAPQPVLPPPECEVLEEPFVDDRPLRPEKERHPERREARAEGTGKEGREGNAKKEGRDEKERKEGRDEPAEASQNGDPDAENSSGGYYEDYNEDAEPEEKE